MPISRTEHFSICCRHSCSSLGFVFFIRSFYHESMNIALLAKVNSLYRVRDENVTLIAKVNPQEIHQSYLLPSPIQIIAGDYVIGQCVYDNTEDRTIKIGWVDRFPEPKMRSVWPDACKLDYPTTMKCAMSWLAIGMSLSLIKTRLHGSHSNLAGVIRFHAFLRTCSDRTEQCTSRSVCRWRLMPADSDILPTPSSSTTSECFSWKEVSSRWSCWSMVEKNNRARLPVWSIIFVIVIGGLIMACGCFLCVYISRKSTHDEPICHRYYF